MLGNLRGALVKRLASAKSSLPLAIRAAPRNANTSNNLSALTANFSTTNLSWTTQEESLQKMTTQALIHEISMKQMQSAAAIVPWFLSNMPSSYFRQVPEDMRKQHLTVIAVINK